MVKLATKDIEQFIVNVPKNITAILLYGPDAGLVKVRADYICKSRSLSNKFRYEQIKSNPSSLLDSLASIKLFGDNNSFQKVAIIESSGAVLAEPLLSLVKNAEHKGLLLFCAQELGTDSSLRKTFEAGANLAAVPCYVDDQVSVARIIQQILKDRKVTCDPGVVQLLANSITLGNRELIINEVEKLLLFLSDKKHITMDDLNSLQHQGEVSFDALCYCTSLKQVNGIEQLLAKLQSEGHSLVSIIRMLLRHFTRLHQVKSLINSGKNEQEAMSSLSPPVFFKQVADFSKSLKLWNKDELFSMLQSLNELEISSKQTGKPAGLMLKNKLMMTKQ